MNNSVINQLLSRRSVRHFSGEAVLDADLALILQAAQQAPTSVNGQQISLVVTRDKANIRKIAAIAGGQAQVASADVFITLVIDFYRTAEACRLAGESQEIEQSSEGLIVGAVDAGIVLQAIQTAAESLGYGSTAIGGIRRDPEAMIELLGLPSKTFPLLGTTLGVPDQAMPAQTKPRVPLTSFAHAERYDAQQVLAGVPVYDAELRRWWDAKNMLEMPSYVQSTAAYYKTNYFPDLDVVLKKQGLGRR